MAQTAIAGSKRVTEESQRFTTARKPIDRNVRADLMSLCVPLMVLAVVGARVVQTGTLYYTSNPADPTYGHGDLYRYVSMAIPNGHTGWAYESPFLYRILVPLIVHGFYLLGVPFQLSFFSITSLALTVSTIVIYFLVRGAGLSRMEAAFASFAFVTLNWAVSYTFSDYFLIDASAQAFVAAILLAVQREKFVLAAGLATVGAICNERTYIAIAVGVVQLLLPYLRPLSQSLHDVTRLRIASVVRRIPRSTWSRLALLIALPLIATFVVHQIQHPINPPTILGNLEANVALRFKRGGGKLHTLITTVIVSTFFTFGTLFVTALGALPLRVWRRTHFSIWSMLVALLIIAYAYTTNTDNQRMSILGWPFVIMCAAVTISELARRLRVSVALLWAVVLVGEIIFQPALYGKNPLIIPSEIRPFIEHIYIPTMVLLSLVIGGLVLLATARLIPAAPALAFAGGSPAVAPPDEDDGESDRTMKVLIAHPLEAKPIPSDNDSAFWIGYRGGVSALAGRCLWLATDRLQDLASAHLVPMTARVQGWDAAGPGDPRWRDTLARWQPAAVSFDALWMAYQNVLTEYQSLRKHVGVPPSPRPDLERDALAALDVGLRQQHDDTRSVLTWQTLSIVLPAYNEEAVIAQTIQDCLRVVWRFCPNAEIIVVDDGSRDRTSAIADEWASRDARVVVVHDRPNKDYGGALQAGFAAARGEWLFFMDSGGQFDIAQIADLLRVANAHPGSAVLGYRMHRRDPLVRRLDAWGWKQLVGVVLGLRGIRDIDCAFKLLPARVVRACDLQAQGAMVNTEMLVKMRRMHVPMEQVPVKHFSQTHETSNRSGARTTLREFRELMRLRAG